MKSIMPWQPVTPRIENEHLYSNSAIIFQLYTPMLLFGLNHPFVARHVLVFQKAREWLLPRRYLQVDSSGGVRVSRDFDAGAWVCQR